MSHRVASPFVARTLRVPTLFLAGSMALALLGGCNKPETPTQKDELQWAKAALERNPQFKVLSVDVEQKLIKVKVVATGDTVSVSPGELAALPISDLVALTQKAQLAQAPAAQPAATEELAVSAPAPEPAAPPDAGPGSPGTGPSTPASFNSSAYTVQREDGRVRVTGPGVSIETASKPSAASASTSQVHIDDPIVCDGKRLLHIDGRQINVDGDAIVARGGCELHITNSRITATGTAVTVLDATVHIGNSELRGDGGSLTTSSAARLFIRNNRFFGLARRSPEAKIQELGGNSWR